MSQSQLPGAAGSDAPIVIADDDATPHLSDQMTIDVALSDAADSLAEDRKRKGDEPEPAVQPAIKRSNPGLPLLSTLTAPSVPRTISLQTQIMPFVAHNGGLLFNANVEAFAKLMKKVSKEDLTFENQSLLMNVLLRTNNQAVLTKFIQSLGPKILISWLVTAIKAGNDRLVKKLLELLHHLPKDIALLDFPRVNQLMSKIEQKYKNEEIRQQASALLANWESIVEQHKAMLAAAAETTTAADAAPGDAAATAARGDTLPAGPPTRIIVPDATTAELDDNVAFESAPTTPTTPTTLARRPVFTRRVEMGQDGESAAPVEPAAPASKLLPTSILKRPRPATHPDMPELTPVAAPQPKRRVRFREEHELAEVHEFYSHADQRSGGYLPNSRDWDRAEGREIFSGRSVHLRPTIAWRTPVALKPAVILPFGENSVERTVQMERERSTLATLYGSLDMVPESPAEPTGAESTTSMTMMDLDGDNTVQQIPWEMIEDMGEGDDDEVYGEGAEDISDVARQFVQLLYSQLPMQPSTYHQYGGDRMGGAPTSAHGLDANSLALLLSHNPVLAQQLLRSQPELTSMLRASLQ